MDEEQGKPVLEHVAEPKLDEPLGEDGAARTPLLVLRKITDILDTFSPTHPEQTHATIRESTGLPASTAQRLVGNLVASGFLERTDTGFRIGAKLGQWAAASAQQVEILDIVQPALLRLRNRSGETACYFRASSGHRVCVAIAETAQMLRIAMHVGRVLPLHAGSAGRVLLAWDTGAAERVLASALDRVTEHTIIDREALRQALDKTRRQGYAITAGERESDASGVSAPVFDSQGDVSGALTIMGPTLRLSRQRCQEWVEELMAAAGEITRITGGRAPVPTMTVKS